jgi:hypothetical protein
VCDPKTTWWIIVMSQDVFSHFGELDELVQVIYHGFERFVLLSNVSDESWMIHVGLLGDEGRWWRGTCSEKEVLQTTVRRVLQFPVRRVPQFPVRTGYFSRFLGFRAVTKGAGILR